MIYTQMLWLALCFVVSTPILYSTQSIARDVHVRGYFRKDGTYVQPHHRSAPDGNFYNNWSTKGNINPYTGEEGTKIMPESSSHYLYEPDLATQPTTSDAFTRQFIIQQSILDYMATGKNCPCPYNYASNGSICGERSAYSRPGGAEVFCYPDDVPEDKVSHWK